MSLTIVAAVGIASARQRPDPCGSATFSDSACEAAVQNRGYCWNGKWIRLTYHYPYPYYYDAYQQFIANGGSATPLVIGTCLPPVHSTSGAHGGSRAGFGSTGSCHASAHG